MSTAGNQFPQKPLPVGQPVASAGQRSNLALYIVLVVLLGLGMMILACGGATYFFVRGVKRGVTKGAVELARVHLNARVEHSDLSESDQSAVIAQVARVADAYKAGKLGTNQAMFFMDDFENSPLFSLATLAKVKSQRLESSGLADEEKQQALLTIDRAMRGVLEELIDGDDVKRVVEQHLMEVPSQQPRFDVEEFEESLDDEFERELETFTFFDGLCLKATLTDDELRACLATLKQMVDSIPVPEERFEADIVGGFRRNVDRLLGGGIW